MIGARFDDITSKHIEDLLTNQVQERRTLDYKRDLPGPSEGERKEFLADVSSFANAAGGDIIFGVDEDRDEKGQKTGRPREIVGLGGTTGDEAIRRLESMVRDSIAPRLNVQTRAIDCPGKGTVILIRVRQSLSAPHMVAMGSSRFYSRNSAGKYALDVQEIRSAFAASEAVPERIRRFREERLARIVADETPVLIRSGPRAVLHIVPVMAFSAVMRHPDFVPGAQAAAEVHKALGVYQSRYNIDGYMGSWPGMEGGCERYVQFFRSGALEYVDTRLYDEGQGRVALRFTLYEANLVRQLGKFAGVMRMLNVPPPSALLLTLLSVKGVGISAGAMHFNLGSCIDRDAVLAPDVVMEDYGVDPGRTLRPLFDAVWQASGYAGSPNYDEEGNWVQ